MPFPLFMIVVVVLAIYVRSRELKRLEARLDQLAAKYEIDRQLIQIVRAMRWVTIRINSERPDPKLAFDVSVIEVQERARYGVYGFLVWATLVASFFFGAHFRIWT
jgi:hypothetical protein